MTTVSATPTLIHRSRRQRIGLALAGFLSVTNIGSAIGPQPPEGGDGPPAVIIWAGTVLGVVGLAAVVMAWRTGNRAALRVAAGAIIITTLTSLPAFFVDVPAALKALVALGVLLTVAAVLLMFSSEGRAFDVTD